jgi:hypothetical protein
MSRNAKHRQSREHADDTGAGPGELRCARREQRHKAEHAQHDRGHPDRKQRDDGEDTRSTPAGSTRISSIATRTKAPPNMNDEALQRASRFKLMAVNVPPKVLPQPRTTGPRPVRRIPPVRTTQAR